MSRVRRPQDGGLCVLDMDDPNLSEVAPVLESDVWRVVPKPGTYLTGGDYLYFYWESQLANTRGFWVYANSAGNWIYVKKNEAYVNVYSHTRRLYPEGDGSSWEYSIHDFAQAVILILPPGMVATKIDPPAQATVKHDRLMLYVRRPAGHENYVAALELHRAANQAEVLTAAGNLNKSYRTNRKFSHSAKNSSVKSADSVSMLIPDRALQATLWGALVACVGIIIAAEALTRGSVRALGFIFGIVAGALSAAWLIGTQFVPRYRKNRKSTHASP